MTEMEKIENKRKNQTEKKIITKKNKEQKEKTGGNN